MNQQGLIDNQGLTKAEIENKMTEFVRQIKESIHGKASDQK